MGGHRWPERCCSWRRPGSAGGGCCGSDHGPALGPSAASPEQCVVDAAPGSVRGVVLLAVAVGAVEVATMLPYFAAIDVVGDAGLGWEFSSLLLAAYVLVTLSPALVLLAARVFAQERVSSITPALLRRVDRWSGDVWATVLLVVGALLAANAAIELNLV
ncbi:hypothetical protein AYK61_23900 [Rhodococcus sp. SBT000017]|nr:hypothetical protein AYK61_23900 [Rhodococcus sp. SBT000017]